MSAVERYLEELRGRLPLTVRSRVLAEVEDHLRESAREVGEDEAVARFGPVQALADSYRGRVRWVHAALGLLAALAYPVLSYPIPENSLPPAPWPNVDAMPPELAWKREWIVVLFLFAVVAGAGALGGYLRDRRLLVWPATLALAAIGLAGALGTVLRFEWRRYVPGTPDGLLVLGPLQVAVALVGLALLARAASPSRV
ncbi:MAG TPA: hypothetical protein VGQ84_06545 [Gaiellaceae bacterium]|nr:hypothetical protein [Gaiellaceae bacterium]